VPKGKFGEGWKHFGEELRLAFNSLHAGEKDIQARAMPLAKGYREQTLLMAKLSTTEPTMTKIERW
jgi:hypothetical protein